MQRMFLVLNKIYANSKGLFIVALFGLVVLSCSSFNTGMADNNNSLAVNTLVIEPAAEIPVLDGKATTTGIYVHNYSDFTIQNIRYDSLAINGTQRVIFPSDNLCNEVAAHSSCLLTLTAPALQANDRGSSLITAYFNEQKTKQLVNYSYVDSQSRHGISFSGDVNVSATNYNEGQRATAYVFGGNHQSFQHVGFYAENNSVSVVSDLELGRRMNIAANTVMPLEIWIGNNVIKNNVKIIPYVEEDINYSSIKSPYEMERVMNGYLANKRLNAEDILNVVISPTIRANLLMSNLPTFKGSSSTESSMTLTVYNNGNLAATAMSLTAADSSSITIAPASTNPCGTTLAIGASCNYQVSLNNSYTNGSQSLSLTYTTNAQQYTSYLNISYYSSLSEPMVTVSNLSGASIVFPQPNGSAQNTSVTIQNTSNAPLVNPQYSVISSAGLATTTSVISNYNTCSTTLMAAGSSCTLTVTVTPGSQAESGVVYARVRGDGNYSFVGMRTTVTVLNPAPYITSITPADGSTNVNTSNSLILNFSQAMNATTLNTNNIQLQKISTSELVPLTFLGVSGNNQTVTFSVTANGPLTDFSSYQIVINPSAIKSSTNVAMSSSTYQVVSTFTTGDYTAPQVISYQPYNGASLQSLLSTVRLSFSESMLVANLNSTNIQVRRKRDGQLVSIPTVQWVDSELSVYMQHVQFESSESYQLIVNESQIQDSSINHNPMGTVANYVVSQFTTGNYLLPTVSSVSPLNGAIGVSASAASIQITFSQPMDKTTITNSTVTLTRVYDGANIPLTNESFNYLNNLVSFSPSSALQPNVQYQITLPTPSAIKDANGNAMDSATPTLQGTFTATTNANAMILYGDGQGGDLGTVAIGESVGESKLYIAGNTNTFQSMTANNSGRLLLLGNTTLLTVSDDNGTTWKSTPVSAGLVNTTTNTKIYCARYNSLCLASGASSSSIARSTDGGKTWSSVTITSTFLPNQIVCDTSTNISTTNCFMNYRGQTTKSILRSTDGGATWSSLAVATTGTIYLYGIDIYTNPSSGTDTLFVAGYDGTTGFISSLTSLSSSTLSKNFPTSQIAANSRYQVIGCDSSYCYAVSSNGYYALYDGTSWVYKGFLTNQDVTKTASCYKSTTTGCIFLGSAYVASLQGTTTNATNSPNANLSNIFLNSSNNTAYWSGSYGNIAKSSALALYGLSFVQGPFTTNYSMTAFTCRVSQCVRAFRTLATNTLGYLQYSSDGGSTWTNSNYSFSSATSGSDPLWIQGLGNNVFVAVSQIAILRSTDGGVTWTSVKTLVNDTWMLSCYQTKCLLSSGTASTAGYLSSDSGSTWSTVTTTNNSTNSLFCWGTTCLIAGPTTVQRSTNFGTSWSNITMPSGFAISNTISGGGKQISCVGVVCLIAGNDTVTGKMAIFRSTNSGATWSSISSAVVNISGSSWVSVQCSDNFCLALPQQSGIPAGTMPIYSTDLGLTWQPWSKTYSTQYNKIYLNLN